MIVALFVAVAALVWLVWGPLLVTSAEEALAKAQGYRASDGRTYAEIAAEYEEATGRQGGWNVRRNDNYDSWFEGDRGGFLWIVTYAAPRSDGAFDFRLEIWVKNLTGEVSAGG